MKKNIYPMNVLSPSASIETRLSESFHVAERRADGSRGLQPTVFGRTELRRGATPDGCGRRRRLFNRRSATTLFLMPDRGLKPTATVNPSLREEPANTNRHRLQTARNAFNPFNPFALLPLLLLTTSGVFAGDLPAVIGITEPFLDVRLSASVPGIITARKFKEGEFVKEGDLIIELDKRLEELEVERRQLVVEARRVDYEGTAKLFKTTKGTSKEEMDKKESDYKLAVVEHLMAEEQLRRRVVKCPLAGTIVELPLQTGESCQPYQAVARVVDTRRSHFVANLDAKSAAT